MASRTQIVCLHEGTKGRSIDPIFIRTLLRALDPAWIRPWKGNNIVRTVDGGGRSDLIARMPAELRSCLEMGGETTLMVWADLDDDMDDGEKLKAKFWTLAQQAGITKEQFAQVVFVFAKDRLENWIEFLLTGATDESMEGPRQKHDRPVADAANSLAQRCQSGAAEPKLPPSLVWSCQNLDRWEFFVLATNVLDAHCKSQRTIGLNTVRRLKAINCDFASLPQAVESAFRGHLVAGSPTKTRPRGY